MPALQRIGYAAWIVLLVVFSISVMSDQSFGKKPAPSNSTSVESVSLGPAGLCLGLGHHNPNSTGRNVIFGLDYEGVYVQPSPKGFLKEITDGDSCGYTGPWFGSLGLQYGQRMSDDSVIFFGTVGYRVSLGGNRHLYLESGSLYEGFGEKRKEPTTVNLFDFFPFFMFSYEQRF